LKQASQIDYQIQCKLKTNFSENFVAGLSMPQTLVVVEQRATDESHVGENVG